MLLFPIPEFKQTLDERYTYSTGGSNVNEYWNYPHQMGTAVNSSIDESGDIDRKSFGLHTQETCTQYNILKVVSIVIFFKKKALFFFLLFAHSPFLKECTILQKIWPRSATCSNGAQMLRKLTTTSARF